MKQRNLTEIAGRAIRRGDWRVFDMLNIGNVRRSTVYRSESEPSYVCWSILWREQGGVLKLSFTEVQGDLAEWPPSYQFNRPGVSYYLKTLVSEDGGATWRDTGWKEPLDPDWASNADHHIRHVVELPDGTLLRNYCRTAEGIVVDGTKAVYDEMKAWEEYPFNELHGTPIRKKAATIWASKDKGRTWEEIYRFPREEHFFVTGFHRLRDGTIVAVGAVNPDHVNAFEKNWTAIAESRDDGKTWSKPQKLLTNDDYILPQGLCEEYDFVELDDGRLLMVMRTDGLSMHMLQTYLQRDKDGVWRATPPATNPLFRHSGYPYLHRAGDGTVFFYTLYGLLYSCDDGRTWHEYPIGNSYYGQLTEIAPGRMLAVSQQYIGDAAFPYVHDTSIVQTTFDFSRTGVLEQTNADLSEAFLELDERDFTRFHLFAEMRADGETGIVFARRGDDYHFAVVGVPCNDFRAPGAAAGREQNAYLMYGKKENGRITVLRRVFFERLLPSSWVAVQVAMADGTVKIAVKKGAGSPAKYLVVRDDFAPGKIGVFTNRSTGAFRNVILAEEARPLRDHWGDYADAIGSTVLMREKQY